MSHYYSSMEDQNHTEMQLLSYPTPLHAGASSSSLHPQSWPSDSTFDPSSSLDLQLSISVTPLLKPIRKASKYRDNNINHHQAVRINSSKSSSSCVEVLKWQAAEQIRMAAMERAYAERVREMTRREMEQAQSEFARARALWERAREEVERAEKLKKRATQKTDNRSCMEITCQSCRQTFTP